MHAKKIVRSLMTEKSLEEIDQEKDLSCLGLRDLARLMQEKYSGRGIAVHYAMMEQLFSSITENLIAGKDVGLKNVGRFSLKISRIHGKPRLAFYSRFKPNEKGEKTDLDVDCDDDF
jgi:hypothetical protein